MLFQILFLIAGLFLLLIGGDTLVRGASGLARAMRISPLIIGLTIVAFGTSAPEMAVNILAAAKGSGSLSFGNIIGSNLANIGLVLGVAAVIRALHLKSVLISREIPMMILGTAAVVIMALSPRLGGAGDAVFFRTEGLLLLLFFAVFLYYTGRDLVRQRQEVEETKKEVSRKAEKSKAFNTVLFLGGLIGLVFGGKITVDAASEIARHFKVSEDVIGLTVLAIGTSLPELVTAVMATLHDESDIAVGNVVGSNIFNLLLVLPVTALVGEVPVPDLGYADLAMLSLISLLLLPIAMSGQRRIVRKEGLLLILAYAGYMTWRVF
jgi:cation:H+ antiporter